jgi:hypothetical protein
LHIDGTLQHDACVARLATASNHYITQVVHTGLRLADRDRADAGQDAICALSSLRGMELHASGLAPGGGEEQVLHYHALPLYPSRRPVAIFDLCTLAVDMTTRQATSRTDFNTLAAP